MAYSLQIYGVEYRVYEFQPQMYTNPKTGKLEFWAYNCIPFGNRDFGLIEKVKVGKTTRYNWNTKRIKYFKQKVRNTLKNNGQPVEQVDFEGLTHRKCSYGFFVRYSVEEEAGRKQK